MAVADWPGLAGAVDPDPWIQRDKLTSGEPGAIYDLAGAFESAAREAESATRTGAWASLETGEAYQVDGTEVHAVDAETGRTRELLGGGGDDLERIGRILRGIGDELTDKAGTAEEKVVALEDTLRRLQNEFAEYEANYEAAYASGPPILTVNPFEYYRELEDQYASELRAFRDRSKDEAERVGRDIRDNLVSVYDDMLGARTSELSDLGYTVPTDVDQGPGDVESDPDAGSRDAQAVSDALDLDPGQQGLAEIDAAMGQIRAINEKVANGEPLTSDEQAYLNQFYETLGEDDLARVPNYLYEANMNTAGPGAPSDALEIMTEDDLQPFGDSIMNLSQVPGARYESLPAPVRDLLDTRLGYVDPDTGARHLNPRMLEYPDGSNSIAHIMGDGVTGQNRVSAITDMLGASDVVPGNDLALTLTDRAIQARQDLNEAYVNSRYPHSPAEFDRGVSALLDDSTASDMLSVAARNNDVSSDVLLDENRRPAILGLNWEDATGAADLVRAGTESDTAQGGGTRKQAEAALAVVQEVGNDRGISRQDEDGNVLESTGYLDRMADPVKRAVNDAGFEYIEAFAENPVRDDSEVVPRTDSFGNDLGPSLELSLQDRNRFLQFVSGTGEDHAAEFQAKAQLWGQTEIATALESGDPGEVHSALTLAGRLDGAIAQANYDYTADQVAGDDAAAADRARSQTIEARATQGALNTLAVLGKEVIPGGSAVSVLTEALKGEIGMLTIPPSAPSGDLVQSRDDMERLDATWAGRQGDLALAGAMDLAGRFDDGTRPEALAASEEDLLNDSPMMRDLDDDVLDEWNRWRTDHGMSEDVDKPSSYADAREEAYTTDYDGADDWNTPDDAAWHDNRLYYGDSGAGDLPDPRRLDDPDAWVW